MRWCGLSASSRTTRGNSPIARQVQRVDESAGRRIGGQAELLIEVAPRVLVSRDDFVRVRRDIERDGLNREDYQVVGTTKVHFDDREEAAAAFAARGISAKKNGTS